MKKISALNLIVLLIASLFVASCSSVEDAAAKFKTPDAPNAGLKDGEKSHYLLDKTATPDTTTKKPAKKKKTK